MSARRSLIVGAVATTVALGFGARDVASLVLLFTAAFAADMNLRAVMRKASQGKLGGAGGYLAHVGVGIMLAGVVVSGNYAKIQRLTLKVNTPTMAGDSKLTFLRVVPGSAERKQAMEVRVETASGKSYYAYPKMYENSKTGQLMANPSIKSGAVTDLYIAPQQYDPGQPEVIGRDVRLAKGTTTNIEGTGFTFRDFNADRAAMMRGEKTILVLTDLTITPPDGTQHDTTIKYVYHLDDRRARARGARGPGSAGREDAGARGLSQRRRRRPAPDGNLEEPGRRVPGRDRRVAVGRGHAEASHRPGLGRLLRHDGRRHPRLHQEVGRSPPRGRRSRSRRGIPQGRARDPADRPGAARAQPAPRSATRSRARARRAPR